MEDFNDVYADFLGQGIGSLGASSSSSALTTVRSTPRGPAPWHARARPVPKCCASHTSSQVLESSKPEPSRPTKKMMLELKKMADGQIDGDEGTTLKLFGDSETLPSEVSPEMLRSVKRHSKTVNLASKSLDKFCKDWREIVSVPVLSGAESTEPDDSEVSLPLALWTRFTIIDKGRLSTHFFLRGP